jgi:hypothetical protein
MPPVDKRKNPAPENVAQQPASTASEQEPKNQQKPKTSIRSRVPRSQWNNSFRLPVHGQILRHLIPNPDAEMQNGIAHLCNSLKSRFDADDVVNLLLIELIGVDYWRLAKAAKYESEAMSSCDAWCFSRNGMPTCVRYVAAARRNLDNSLKTLRELEKEAAEAGASDTDAEEATSAAPAACSSSQSQPDEPSPQAPPAPPAASSNEASAAEQAAAATSVQPGEEPTKHPDNPPEEQPTTAEPAPLSPADNTGAQQPAAAASKPAEAVAEATGKTAEDDSPKAA